jgi:hypothetical protein
MTYRQAAKKPWRAIAAPSSLIRPKYSVIA